MSKRSTRSKVVASVALVGVLLAAVSVVVFSAFSSVVENEGNTFRSGSVELSGNAPGTALFDMDGMKPGSTRTRCITITHAQAGGLTSTVRMYGAQSGTLNPYLSTKITRGSQAPPAGVTQEDVLDCAGFQADATDYPGGPAGAGVIFDDKLAAFPTTYATGLVDPDSTWDAESAVYRVQVTLDDANDAKQKSSAQEFAWEARSN